MSANETRIIQTTLTLLHKPTTTTKNFPAMHFKSAFLALATILAVSSTVQAADATETEASKMLILPPNQGTTIIVRRPVNYPMYPDWYRGVPPTFMPTSPRRVGRLQPRADENVEQQEDINTADEQELSNDIQDDGRYDLDETEEDMNVDEEGENKFWYPYRYPFYHRRFWGPYFRPYWMRPRFF